MMCQKRTNPSVDCVAAPATAGRPTVNLTKFADLEEDGRALVRGWFSTARSKSGDDGRGPFDRFIFAWIAFNGWACCVTDKESDRQWRDALASDQCLREFFSAAVRNDERLKAAVTAFIGLWPIFKTIDLKRKNLADYGTGDRRKLVENYLNRGAKVYAPCCWKIHDGVGDPSLRDWPHTLHALYRVRCNLFHGEKGYTSQSDHTIVAPASLVLLRFLDLADLFGEHPLGAPPERSREERGSDSK